MEKCADPDYRDALRDYLKDAQKVANGQHTPHIMGESLAWHRRFLQSGSMK